MRALFVLTPMESKRIIGKAVANMEEVKRASKHYKLLIGHGSTNVAVAEELLGKEKVAEFFKPERYLSGITKNGILCTTLGEEKPPILVLNRGAPEPPADTMSELLRDFGAESVFVKGANAVDLEGNAGTFVAHPEGGTIGWAIGTILARGIHLIVPVGLEKLVPSVKESVAKCGQLKLDYCQGLRVGMIPLSGGKIVTEIEALRMLTGVESFHVASGGYADAQGAVTLISEGSEEAVGKAIRMIEEVKGELPLQMKRGTCETCLTLSPVKPNGYEKRPAPCQFFGKATKDLPPYLRNR